MKFIIVGILVALLLLQDVVSLKLHKKKIWKKKHLLWRRETSNPSRAQPFEAPPRFFRRYKQVPYVPVFNKAESNSGAEPRRYVLRNPLPIQSQRPYGGYVIVGVPPPVPNAPANFIVNGGFPALAPVQTNVAVPLNIPVVNGQKPYPPEVKPSFPYPPEIPDKPTVPLPESYPDFGPIPSVVIPPVPLAEEIPPKPNCNPELTPESYPDFGPIPPVVIPAIPPAEEIPPETNCNSESPPESNTDVGPIPPVVVPPVLELEPLPVQPEPEYGPPTVQPEPQIPPSQPEPEYGPPQIPEPEYGPPEIPPDQPEPEYGPPPPENEVTTELPLPEVTTNFYPVTTDVVPEQTTYYEPDITTLHPLNALKQGLLELKAQKLRKLVPTSNVGTFIRRQF